MSYHSGNHLIDPYELFDRVQLHEGMHIADFGCGRTGHVVFPGSKVVGERGIVYAVDVLKDVLENIRRRAAIEALHNIEVLWADLEIPNSITIAPKTLDIGFYVNMLFHFKNYDIALGEAHRVLRLKGRIVVLDWSKRLSTLGPQDGEMVDFGAIEQWGLQNGFVVQEDYYVGDYHRCMILYRQE